MPKVAQLIKERQDKGTLPFHSLEYFPPRSQEGVQNLYDRIERMQQYGPLWIDVTWGAGGSTSALTLDICRTAQQLIGVETMMHLTCTNMPVSQITEALAKAKEAGICNILALRGDPPAGQEWKQYEGGFGNAIDLVRFIRKEYGDYFGITVAGYPEGHIDNPDKEADLRHLKAKVDAGADCIVTQLFYDVELFLKFVRDCRALGITVPILPGIMPIQTYAGFKRMTTLCKTSVPQAIHDALEPIKDNDEAVKAYGVDLCARMCRELLAGGVPGLHFYTLNLEKSVLETLRALALVDDNLVYRRTLPWKPVQAGARAKEDVRPIFWSNRPKSYLSRTMSWDDFPNGRWGDARSPAYGELTDYHLTSLYQSKAADCKAIWGAPQKLDDLCTVFANYVRGDIPRLPWNESPVALETEGIRDALLRLNRAGFLTINSQPPVNGASSGDRVNGWGPSTDGYVYQKAYVEFFVSPALLKRLLAEVSGFASVTYHAANRRGESHTNINGPTAVTWGVFPGREIIQPTVVDPNAFLVWKDEAFALWSSVWAPLYEPGTPERQLIDSVVDEFYLVNIVENNFISGNIFAIFDKVINQAADIANGAAAAVTTTSTA